MAASAKGSKGKGKDDAEKIVPLVYANSMRVSHGEHDFVIDFGLVTPDQKGVQPGVRIHTSPEHAKAMLLALLQNIAKYEKRFGKIPQPSDEKVRRVLEQLMKEGEGGNDKLISR